MKVFSFGILYAPKNGSCHPGDKRLHPGSGVDPRYSRWIRIQNSWNPATLKLVERPLKGSRPPPVIVAKNTGDSHRNHRGGDHVLKLSSLVSRRFLFVGKNKNQ